MSSASVVVVPAGCAKDASSALSKTTYTTSNGPTSTPTPAPTPSINAWDKPISLTIHGKEDSKKKSNILPEAATKSAHVDTGPKYMKNDQHDSGIEISEHQDSAVSSTRSSPSTEPKIKTDSINQDMGKDTISTPDTPKPQRQAKLRVAEKLCTSEEAESKSLKIADASDINTDLTQYSFNDAFKYSKTEDSDMKLDFTYNGSLKLDGKVDGPKVPSKPLQSDGPQNITSPGTDDLGLKIASVKNVWSSMFEHDMSGSATPVPASSSANNAQASVTSVNTSASPTSQPFCSFSNNNTDQSIEINLKKTLNQNVSVSRCISHSPGPVLGLGNKPISDVIFDNHELMSSMTSNTSVSMSGYMESDINKVLLSTSEQSNVCKVKPQLQTPGGSNIMQTVAHVQQTIPLQQAVQPPTSHLSATMSVTSTSPQPQAQAVLLQAESQSPTTNSLSTSLSNLTSPPAPTQPSYIIAAAAPVSHYQQLFGSSQLIDQRYTPQTYGLTQQTGGSATLVQPAAFNQHSLFLPTAAPNATGPGDLFQSTATQSFRNPYGTQQNPAAIIVATTSSIMPSMNKPQQR